MRRLAALQSGYAGGGYLGRGPVSAGRVGAAPVGSLADRAALRQEISEVREQAQEIIESVLNGNGMAGAEAVVRLRSFVARYPDEPERALLEHLMETGRVNRGTYA